MLKNCIFLIGYMGVGKTTVGKGLALELNATFIDIDSVIEQAENKTISEIFTIHGEAHFRSLEANFIASIPEKYPIHKESFVFSTGGGLPCFSNLMEELNHLGTAIYLKSSATAIAQRLQHETSQRPLLAGKTDEELILFIENQLKVREPFYVKASLNLDTTFLSPQITIKNCLLLLESENM
jgi:shikimate kinase